jgi:hypothetical protein
MPHDRGNRRDRDHREPDTHHRPEESSDPRGTARLNRKQHQQNEDGERHHIGIEGRGDELDAFDRRQHRQRRRDHGVAVKQRAADDPEQHDRASAFANCALRQRHQRQRSAFAVVVGPQQDDDIFQRHHDDQRPQDQGEDAEHGLRGCPAFASARGHHRFAQRVERAGADVAIDDTDAPEHQGPEAGGGMRLPMPVGRGRFRRGNRTLGRHGDRASVVHCTAQCRSKGLYSRRECIG